MLQGFFSTWIHVIYSYDEFSKYSSCKTVPTHPHSTTWKHGCELQKKNQKHKDPSQLALQHQLLCLHMSTHFQLKKASLHTLQWSAVVIQLLSINHRIRCFPPYISNIKTKEGQHWINGCLQGAQHPISNCDSSKLSGTGRKTKTSTQQYFHPATP